MVGRQLVLSSDKMHSCEMNRTYEGTPETDEKLLSSYWEYNSGSIRLKKA